MGPTDDSDVAPPDLVVPPAMLAPVRVALPLASTLAKASALPLVTTMLEPSDSLSVPKPVVVSVPRLAAPPELMRISSPALTPASVTLPPLVRVKSSRTVARPAWISPLTVASDTLPAEVVKSPVAMPFTAVTPILPLVATIAPLLTRLSLARVTPVPPVRAPVVMEPPPLAVSAIVDPAITVPVVTPPLLAVTVALPVVVIGPMVDEPVEVEVRAAAWIAPTFTFLPAAIWVAPVVVMLLPATSSPAVSWAESAEISLSKMMPWSEFIVINPASITPRFVAPAMSVKAAPALALPILARLVIVPLIDVAAFRLPASSDAAVIATAPVVAVAERPLAAPPAASVTFVCALVVPKSRAPPVAVSCTAPLALVAVPVVRFWPAKRVTAVTPLALPIVALWVTVPSNVPPAASVVAVRDGPVIVMLSLAVPVPTDTGPLAAISRLAPSGVVP